MNDGRFKKGHITWNKGIHITLVCECCEKDYQVQPYRKNKSHFCSRTCAGKMILKGLQNKPKIQKQCYCGKKFQVPPSLERIECCSRSCARKKTNSLKNANKQLRLMIKNKKPTSIERIVYEYLLSRGVKFEKQKLINNRFYVDAYVPSLNLVVECDGNYWHSLDRVVKKDKAENAYLTKCGFNMLRFSEEEIKDSSFQTKFEERLVN